MVQLTMTLVTNFAPKGLRHVAWGWRFLPTPGTHAPTFPKAPKGRRYICEILGALGSKER